MFLPFQVKAEKDKKIRELTDPDHAWDVATPEPDAKPAAGMLTQIFVFTNAPELGKRAATL